MMRFRQIGGLLASFATMHFMLVTGEVECVHASRPAISEASHATGSSDCDHTIVRSGAAPHVPSRGSQGHTREHGSMCCAALAACSAMFASAAVSRVQAITLITARIAPLQSILVPAPLTPPDPPPPKP